MQVGHRFRKGIFTQCIPSLFLCTKKTGETIFLEVISVFDISWVIKYIALNIYFLNINNICISSDIHKSTLIMNLKVKRLILQDLYFSVLSARELNP